MLFIFNFYSVFCKENTEYIMKKIVIFASGSGTNAENIIKYFADSKNVKISFVFSNKSDAKVLEKAKNLKIATDFFSKTDLNEGKVLQKLNLIQPDLIVLAGFLLKLPKNIIETYPNKIINIHPALLPKYGGKGMYGMNIHKTVVENKEKETGISIHFVNEHYDEGAIIFQQKVKLSDGETPEDVAAKIHELEQQFFPKVIEKLLS